jgi:ketosteroid isomerase-like protein
VPQENVDLVRRVIAAFNSGDLDASIAEVSEDLELDWSNSIGPLKGVYRGREGLRDFWRAFFEAWEEVRWSLREGIEINRSTVLAVNDFSMRGRESGVEVAATGAQVWTIESGRARRVKLYQSKADALAALELEG